MFYILLFIEFLDNKAEPIAIGGRIVFAFDHIAFLKIANNNMHEIILLFLFLAHEPVAILFGEVMEEYFFSL